MPPYRRLLVLLTLTIFSSPLWADDPPAPAKQPITEEEAREFGQEFARRFAAGDAVWLSDRIDVAGMMWQATKGEKDVSARVLRTRASRRIQGVSETVRSILPKEGALVSFQLKRVQNVDGVWKGLFRLLLKSANFNFYELDFVRKKNGELGVADFYFFGSGQSVTDIFTDDYILARDSHNKTGPAGETKPSVKEKQIDEIYKLFQSRQYRSVIDRYEASIPEVQKNKSTQQIRLKAAVILHQVPYYQKAIEDFKKNSPNDPSLYMVLIDACLASKNRELGVKAVDHLTERTGEDSYLDYLKGTFYLMDGKPEEALRWAKKGAQREPDIIHGYELLLDASLQLKDHAMTKEAIEVLETRFLLEFRDFKELPQYADFVKSPEYEDYIYEREQTSGEAKPEF